MMISDAHRRPQRYAKISEKKMLIRSSYSTKTKRKVTLVQKLKRLTRTKETI